VLWGFYERINLRGDDGNVGIIRSPLRAIVLLDRPRRSLRSRSSRRAGSVRISNSSARSSATVAERRENALPAGYFLLTTVFHKVAVVSSGSQSVLNRFAGVTGVAAEIVRSSRLPM
jgi:hypothetical protein